MSIRKHIAVVGALLFLATAGVALAQDNGQGNQGNAVGPEKQPTVLQVGGAGHVLLRGTIQSVSSTTITVGSWGGVWTINIPASVQVMPQGDVTSNFQKGDYVGIEGTIDQNANWTVDATVVRDWTQRQALNQESQQNHQSVNQEMHADMPRNLQGTVSNLSGQSFTLSAQDGASYSVSLATNAKILQKHWLTLPWSQIQNGDTVRVWGPVSSSTVTADILRDLSK